MARITVEDCLEKVDNQYDLVLLAKERTVQLNAGAPIQVEEDNDKRTIISLREIGDGKIDVKEVEASAIKRLRKEPDEVEEQEEIEEETNDEFENLYKGQVSKSGVAILPSKRTRRVPEVKKPSLADEALSELKKNKQKSAFPEIMIPLVSTEAEIKIMKDLVINTAKKVQDENGIKIEFLVGTMIELPRAAIKAKDIAKHAEFFSFGTNDLTQTTFGISRDDSGKFLNDYIENKIFTIDPFVSIDEGVKDLVEIAVAKGKKQNKKIKLGICGEHGGDPESIFFCSKVGLNYVSCSPYRVPIARLAAAQAEIKK